MDTNAVGIEIIGEGEEKVNTNASEVPLPDNLLTGKEKYPLAEIALSRSG